MRTYFDCYPCFLRQALSAARRAGATESQQYDVLQNVLALLQIIQPEQNPPEIAHHVHRIVRETVGDADPYQAAKSKSTAEALALYPQLKQTVAENDDPLEIALRISIAGNIIDFGPRNKIENLAAEVYQAINQPIYLDDSKILRARLEEAEHLLFLADNAGETVFDRVLIESLSLPVIYAVKGGAILNDATIEDAVAAGLHQSATLINTGSDAPGTILPYCSAEFRDMFNEAPLVIAKGQANYETLSEAGEKVFCLLQVKCPIIGRDIDAPVGSMIVRQSI
jgi:damage-control phosphatase, subfamily I